MPLLQGAHDGLNGRRQLHRGLAQRQMLVARHAAGSFFLFNVSAILGIDHFFSGKGRMGAMLNTLLNKIARDRLIPACAIHPFIAFVRIQVGQDMKVGRGGGENSACHGFD